MRVFMDELRDDTGAVEWEDFLFATAQRFGAKPK